MCDCIANRCSSSQFRLILTEAQTTWDAAQRTGSRGIFVWESTDLVKWTNERLVQVEDKTAGMVWAPEAIWDANKGQYLVHWASKFYAASDTGHTGSPSNIKIRFACMQSLSFYAIWSPAIRLGSGTTLSEPHFSCELSKTISMACCQAFTNQVKQTPATSRPSAHQQPISTTPPPT